LESLHTVGLSLIAESVKELEEKVQKWQRSLEKKGLEVNTAKTEVLVSSREATKSRINVMDTHGEKLRQVT